MTAKTSARRPVPPNARPTVPEALVRLLETVPVAAFWVSVRHRVILNANRAALVLYGWSAGELAGRSLGRLFPEEKGVAAAIRAALQVPVPVRHRRKNGSPLDVELSAAEWEGGLAILYAQETTHRGDTGERLLRSQRLECIGNLAAGMAHDFNNILTPIVMSAPLLREQCAPEVRDEFLQAIEQSAQRGVHLVKQVLTFARGETGEHVALNPVGLVEEVVSLMRRTFSRSIEVRSRFGPRLREVRGNATRLHQVLLNLVINARDAMEPEGGVLEITARNRVLRAADVAAYADARPGRYVALAVRDHGAGIAPGDIRNIFRPFFTTKDPEKGTGLGLPTVLEIVRRHGGFVTVESKLGRGSLFTAFLPAASGTPQQQGGLSSEKPAKGKPLSAPAFAGRPGVLVIDDDIGLRRMVRAMLARHGYTVTVAESGAEAQALFRQNPGAFGLVLVDLILPEMDGFAIAKALRKLAPKVPIAATSGLDHDERLRRMGEFGISRFLKKPFSPNELLALVAEMSGPATPAPRV